MSVSHYLNAHCAINQTHAVVYEHQTFCGDEMTIHLRVVGRNTSEKANPNHNSLPRICFLSSIMLTRGCRAFIKKMDTPQLVCAGVRTKPTPENSAKCIL